MLEKWLKLQEIKEGLSESSSAGDKRAVFPKSAYISLTHREGEVHANEINSIYLQANLMGESLQVT